MDINVEETRTHAARLPFYPFNPWSEIKICVICEICGSCFPASWQHIHKYFVDSLCLSRNLFVLLQCDARIYKTTDIKQSHSNNQYGQQRKYRDIPK